VTAGALPPGCDRARAVHASPGREQGAIRSGNPIGTGNPRPAGVSGQPHPDQEGVAKPDAGATRLLTRLLPTPAGLCCFGQEQGGLLMWSLIDVRRAATALAPGVRPYWGDRVRRVGCPK